MNFSDIIRTRQSCRAYDPEGVVSREELTACLEAARLAPSACNAQPYRFTVVLGEEAVRLGALTRSMGLNGFTRDVPAYIVISEGPYNRTAAAGAKLKDQDYRSIDIGIAAAYLTAQATELNLATCILGWFDEAKVRELTGAEGKIRLVIAVGRAKADDPLREKKRKAPDILVKWL